jgi:hypothetical protein
VLLNHNNFPSKFKSAKINLARYAFMIIKDAAVKITSLKLALKLQRAAFVTIDEHPICLIKHV